MRRRSALGLALCFALALTMAGAWWWRDRPRSFEIISPTRGPVVELVYATGFAEPAQPVSVSTRLTAPVTQVLVDEGDRVRKGQALLSLDDRELRGALAEAQALSSGATRAEARMRALFAQGWVTRAAFDVAMSNGRAARAASEAARARLDQAVVRAGISGIVTKRDVETGDLAAPGRILMQLGDPDHVRVTATVDERDIGRISAGQTAWLSNDAWVGKPLRARVTALTPTGDPTQRAFRVRLTPRAGTALPLGMTFEVNIVTRQRDGALLAPVSAISGATIWVSVSGRARRRPVLLGITGPQSVEIVAGLSSSDQVIDHPPAELREGLRVTAVR